MWGEPAFYFFNLMQVLLKRLFSS